MIDYVQLTQGAAMLTEVAHAALVAGVLHRDFELLPEAQLRDPHSGRRLRIDFLARPRDSVKDFPFALFGVEVKRNLRADGFTHYTQALRQCIDYKRASIDDQRWERFRGGSLDAVFLYCGAYRTGLGAGLMGASAPGSTPRFGAIRLAGKFNVGEAVHQPYDGLRLEISDQPLWSARRGVTDIGAMWPRERRIGNSQVRGA